jgi:hypothetical protein
VDASKVTISESNGGYKPLTTQRKMELKHEIVKSVIRSKPYGTVLKSIDFAGQLNMSEQGSWTLINNMVRDGIITRHSVSNRRSFYVVNESQTVTTPVVGHAATTPIPPPSNQGHHQSDSGRLRQRVRMGKQLRLAARFRAVDGWKRTKFTASSRER